MPEQPNEARRPVNRVQLLTSNCCHNLLVALVRCRWLGAWTGAWVLSHQGSHRSLIRIWAVTWIFVRLPMNLDLQLTTYLQRGTAKLSSFMLISSKYRIT